MTDPERPPLALLCAVPLEGAELRAALADAGEVEVGRKPATAGTLGGVPVLLFPVGMGKANAAHGATALLETRGVRGVVGFGIAGAYPGSGLAVGDVALASEVVYADEGVETPGGWLSTEGIGIPLLERGGARRFNRFPLEGERVEHARAVLEAAGVRVRVGPALTVSTCSGTTARGAELARRFGALTEGMEGAALGHVCALYDVPFLEVRGISNTVEDRDLSTWRIADAAAAAQRAVRALAAAWPD
ncbi:MAG TPA: futalosine hydrolase [Longimicrobiaceae bacterium]|nr:futalosine hydrolase [Longimicrobiaceae bacterium]